MEETEKEYLKYLREHIYNTQKAFSLLTKLVNWDIINTEKMSEQIANHDNSKYGELEWKAYSDYFYTERTQEVIEAFDYAWLHHQNRNPHHWQYWLLHEDMGNIRALDMPDNYILEMIADWWSFSIKKDDYLEILTWYKKHSSKMILSDKTREKVEDILSRIEEAYR